MKVLVVVATATGRTQRMAEEVAAGAREAGAEVERLPAQDAGESHLLAADAIVLGSGVHMGGMQVDDGRLLRAHRAALDAGQAAREARRRVREPGSAHAAAPSRR